MLLLAAFLLKVGGMIDHERSHVDWAAAWRGSRCHAHHLNQTCFQTGDIIILDSACRRCFSRNYFFRLQQSGGSVERGASPFSDRNCKIIKGICLLSESLLFFLEKREMALIRPLPILFYSPQKSLLILLAVLLDDPEKAKSEEGRNSSMKYIHVPQNHCENCWETAQKSRVAPAPCSRSAHLSFVLSCRKVKYLNMKGSLVDEHTVRALTKAGKEVSCFYLNDALFVYSECEVLRIILKFTIRCHPEEHANRLIFLNLVMHFKKHNLLQFCHQNCWIKYFSASKVSNCWMWIPTISERLTLDLSSQ